MIHTRKSIYSTLSSCLKLAYKYGKFDIKLYKLILFAIILNDLKEWSEYKADDKSEEIELELTDYLLNHPEFKIERFFEDLGDYKNVNTPQDNTTWSRIWDHRNAYLILNNEVKLADTTTMQLPDCVNILSNVILHDKCEDDVIILGEINNN